jgi:hypothetical protein
MIPWDTFKTPQDAFCWASFNFKRFATQGQFIHKTHRVPFVFLAFTQAETKGQGMGEIVSLGKTLPTNRKMPFPLRRVRR